MAITQVRAKLENTWITLNYNVATRRYEGTATPTAISSGQPGGYFNVQVEATNDSGKTTSVDGKNFAALRLVAQDTVPPAVAITSPTNGQMTNVTVIDVTGTVSDAGSGVASVRVNGVAATVTNGTFSVRAYLPDGRNTIRAVAADVAGNTASASVIVLRDTVPPAVAITSPTNGQMTNGTVIDVTGTVSDASSGVASLKVNGVAATVTNGTFSVRVSLSEGQNTITVVAADAAGNTASDSVTVLRDTTFPVLNIITPSADMMTNSPSLTIRGGVADSGSGVAAVTVNGTPVKLTNGVFTLPVALSEGSNVFTITATDRVGNRVSKTRTVLLDTIHPILTLEAPAGYYLVTNTPTVLFSASDEAGGSGLDMETAAIHLDGAAQAQGMSVHGQTISFQPAAPLTEGVHTVTASVRDRAGNQWSLAATYMVDTVPPELTVPRLSSHRVVDWEAFPVAGTATDYGSGIASVTVGGKPVPVREDGAFSAEVPLAVGENTISITAADRAGKTTSLSFWALRLITDRTAEDSAQLLALLQKDWSNMSEAERASLRGIVRGAYHASDFNRVGAAVSYLTEWLTEAGYLVPASPRTDWQERDVPTESPMRRYLRDVELLRSIFPIEAPVTPASMHGLDAERANDIEWILVEADRMRPLLAASPWYAGEMLAGEI